MHSKDRIKCWYMGPVENDGHFQMMLVGGKTGMQEYSGAAGQEENEQCHRRSNLSNKLIRKDVGF